MNCCELSKKQVDLLIKEYGSPLYVFHEDEFEHNYLELLNAFRSIYPKYNIGYSYKTNYTPEIIKKVKNLGGLAEVVSDMEYQLAKKVGYENKDIIYNGPVKGKGLFEHLKNGGVANIDNLDELTKVIEMAKSFKGDISIAFRVNINIGQEFISRFGLDAYEDDRECELSSAFSSVKNISNIKVVGLHCHVGRSRSLEAWKNRISIMFKLVDKFFGDSIPEFIDLGSGMNSIMEPELARQFSGHIPTYKEYVNVVAASMKERYGYLPYDKQPWLYTEPGTTVISGYMSFLSTILSIKNVKNKTYVTFDCSGGNLGDICHLKNLPISIYKNSGDRKDVRDATFVGYTCLEHDHIYENFNGDLAVGDVIQFRNVGSYSNVFKPPFILPNCAMISLSDGNAKLIKRIETIDDVFMTYLF